MKILVTGVTGKVGRHFLERLLASSRFPDARVVALCHNRTLPPRERVEVQRGSVSDPAVVARAMDGVTHVFHLATVKETPDIFVDVSIKGLLNVLEAARASASLRQFVLVGGDAAVGHCLVDHGTPVTEETPHRAYPGVYAFSKVLEEVMVEQYRAQYGLPTTVLRAPWIMEKDDFRYALSFGPDQFGGPPWDELIGADERDRYVAENRVPLLLDASDGPLLRNFVHVSDLVEAMHAVIDEERAIGELFNIAMTDPVDYGEVARLLEEKRSMPPAEISTGFFSNILCNAKARLLLRWRPRVELPELVDSSFAYVRNADDPRTVWYPG